MTGANYSCPSCNGHLVAVTEQWYRCPGCGATIEETTRREAIHNAIRETVSDAVEEWTDRNESIPRNQFDALNSALIRTVGERARHPELGESQHIRRTTAEDVGAFAAEFDVALAELDTDVRYVDLHGYPVDDGYVPVLLCVDGDVERAADVLHAAYHAVEETEACDHCAVTDGGRVAADDGLNRQDWARIITQTENTPSYSEVAQTLASADVYRHDERAAYDAVDEALKSGALIECEYEDRAFAVLELSEPVPDDDTTAPAGPDPAGQDDDEKSEETAAEPVATGEGWGDVDFTAPNSGVWPPELLEREQWMGHVEKKPFAPWADRDHPEAAPDEDARWKWGLTENHVDGETIAIAEDDPRLDGRAFLQQPNDPFVYVDGDDVRDTETGDVHPAFIAILEHLGLTYADVSQSDAGAHAIYRGELPEGVKQASWQLDDEPWGSNEELPSIELYPGKRVCVMTGAHVPGTPTEVRPWNADVLEPLLEANDAVAMSQRATVSTDRSDYDLDGYEPTATSATETTDDVRDIFAALDRLDARAVAERTIVDTWNDSASTSDGKRAFRPTWGPNSRGTANVVDERVWQDTGDEGGYGTPVVMALIDAGEMSHRNASPRAAKGKMWWRGVDHLRELGFDIPAYESSSDGYGGADPVSAIPLEMLSALDGPDARRFAKKRVDWPSTSEARKRLHDRIGQAMRHREDVVIEAPTALGKSYTVATEPWLRRADVTGEAPVVHFSETREARDDAAAKTREHGGHCAVLKGRKDRCAVAAGEHDPDATGEDDNAPEHVVTVNGMTASGWFDLMCDDKGLPFSVAHKLAEEHNDQGHDHLPCCGDPDAEEPTECPGITQWNGIPRDEETGEVNVDVIHASHQFAHVPSLRRGCNVIFDERPDFSADLGNDRIQRAVAAFLKQSEAPIDTWEEFVLAAGYRPNGTAPGMQELDQRLDALRESLDITNTPDREWYLEERNAHTLAPALARGIFYALRDDPDQNGYRSATVPHKPPRLDDHAHDDEEGWNRTWVTVVLDEDNRVQTLRNAPDLSTARSVIGLDAHPSVPLWQRNLKPDIPMDRVLSREERRLWRLFERGLVVVQVGDATRPLASGEYFDEAGTQAVVEHLREHYGDRFKTAITASSVEQQLATLMESAGIDGPQTMHYGEEKSRNDFADETVGFVNGSIDPGDDYVLKLLAEANLDATPQTTTDDAGEEHRAHGRGFIGSDARAAAEILASVRENHVAQAAGRYARDADTTDERAVVFVRTDAAPEGFVDLQVPGVEWLATDTQRDIITALRDRPSATAKELADETGATKRHVAKTLNRFVENGDALCRENAGEHGAHVYRALSRTPEIGLVDVGEQESLVEWITNDAVWSSYTWSFAVSPRPTEDSGDSDGEMPDVVTPPDDGQSGLALFGRGEGG